MADKNYLFDSPKDITTDSYYWLKSFMVSVAMEGESLKFRDSKYSDIDLLLLEPVTRHSSEIFAIKLLKTAIQHSRLYGGILLVSDVTHASSLHSTITLNSESGEKNKAALALIFRKNITLITISSSEALAYVPLLVPEGDESQGHLVGEFLDVGIQVLRNEGMIS